LGAEGGEGRKPIAGWSRVSEALIAAKVREEASGGRACAGGVSGDLAGFEAAILRRCVD